MNMKLKREGKEKERKKDVYKWVRVKKVVSSKFIPGLMSSAISGSCLRASIVTISVVSWSPCVRARASACVGVVNPPTDFPPSPLPPAHGAPSFPVAQILKPS